MKQYIILGHENPDVDSIISGYILEQILRRKGYQAFFVIPDNEIDSDTLKICKTYHIDITKFLHKQVKNASYILVDHYERQVPGKIVAILDHHSTIQKIECQFYKNQKIASTALLIYNLVPHLLNDREKKLVVVASIIDTLGFRMMDKFCPRDKDIVLKLCAEQNLEYHEIEEQSLQSTCLDDLELAYQNGLKKYQYGVYKVMSSYIQIRTITSEEEDNLILYCRKKICDENLSMYVFLIVNILLNTTTVYYLEKDKERKELYSYIASRGSVIMPKVEKYFSRIKQQE